MYAEIFGFSKHITNWLYCMVVNQVKRRLSERRCAAVVITLLGLPTTLAHGVYYSTQMLKVPGLHKIKIQSSFSMSLSVVNQVGLFTFHTTLIIGRWTPHQAWLVCLTSPLALEAMCEIVARRQLVG